MNSNDYYVDMIERMARLETLVKSMTNLITLVNELDRRMSIIDHQTAYANKRIDAMEIADKAREDAFQKRLDSQNENFGKLLEAQEKKIKETEMRIYVAATTIVTIVIGAFRIGGEIWRALQ